MKALRRTIAGILAPLALASPDAWAQTWTGATDNNWSTATNWVGGVAPASANTTSVLFDIPAVSRTPLVDVAWTVNRLEVRGPPPYAFSGFNLVFDGASPLLTLQGAGHSFTNSFGLPSALTVTHTHDVLFSGGIGGASGFTKNGPARMTLTGTSLPGGTLTIGSGTLQLGDGVTGPANAPAIVNNGALETNVSPGLLVNGSITGSGSVTVLGGRLGSFLGTPFAHAGTTTVNLGATLDAQVDNNARLSLDGIMNTGGSTVGSLVGGGNLSINAGTFIVGGDNTSSVFSGRVFGPGAFTKVGTGQLTLAVLAMSAGPITIAAGTLRLGDGVRAPSQVFDVVNNAALEYNGPAAGGITVNGTMTGTGSLTILGGRLGQLGPPFTHTGTTTVSAGGQLDASIINNALLTVATGGLMVTGGSTVGSLTGGGNILINATTLTVGGDNTSTTFSGGLFGTGGLTKIGSGRLIHAGTTMPGGTLTINAGTLRLGNGVTGPSQVVDVVNNAALETNRPGGLTVNGTMTGTGSLTVLGGLLAQFGSVFMHTGTTTVNAGGQLDASITNNALLTINGLMNTGGATVGSLAGAGQLNINGPSATVGGDNTSTTFSGSIASTGALIKNGTGRLTLSGVNTYTGGTTINAGTLAVTGSMLGPVTVNAGGTLGGTGTVAGNVTVNAGGTLSPGLTPGLLNTGNLVVVGVLLEEIEGVTLGTQYDSVNVTGTVDLTAGTLVLAGAYVPALGNTFTIITNDGIDAVTGTFAGLAEGATIAFNGATLRISYIGGTGNDVVLAVLAAPAGATPIPSLSGWSLAILALMLLMAGTLAARRVERR
ncbi:MAG: autotransporter-associated beta strand repeat-containing protein [Usitatibacter sp.]